MISSSARAARNLPSTSSPSRNGRVSSTSRVPSLRSSAQPRMVIAGIRKTKTMGMTGNRERRLATPRRKKVCR